MSREVRRVPLDWRHPVEPNPHWRPQQAGRRRRGDPESALHGPEEMFTPLLGGARDEDEDEADYMPDFGDADLGWCLYETVTEGTPVTPVFATAEALIEYLCTVGQDWEQGPMRRASAEAIVRTGHTLGTLAGVDGRVLRSDLDADVLMGLGDA